MHILETQRLILRPPSHRDEPLLHGLYRDPFVVNAVRDGVYPTIEQSKELLEYFINHWTNNHFGVWMLFVKENGDSKFAGFSGLMYSDPNLTEDPKNVELGTCLHLAASGKGIGVEAGRAAVQFAFKQLKIDKVTAFIRPRNTRSLRKNLKIGFAYVGDKILDNKTMMYCEVTPETVVNCENLTVFYRADL